MENKPEQIVSGSLPTGVFELPGEPAVVIDGVPDVSSTTSNAVVLSNVSDDANAGCGEWLEGREVRKLFGEEYYFGTVTEFDKETGWYRVVYEDGDFEDLDWHELEEVLLPVDITIPLKGLALKTIKKSQKAIHKSGNRVAGSGIMKAKHIERKGKKTEAPGEA